MNNWRTYTSSKDLTNYIIPSSSNTLISSNFPTLNSNKNEKQSMFRPNSLLNNRFVYCEELFCECNEECLVLLCGPCLESPEDDNQKICTSLH